MSSYRQIIYQLVFHTKYNIPCIPDDHCDELYNYIAGIIRNKNCKAYNISGTRDHIHILSDLHPSIALADLMKDVKVASSVWMKKTGLFPSFDGWADGYGAFTYAYEGKENVSKYISNQKEHHKVVNFAEEYKRLLKLHCVVYDEKYFP